MRKRNYIFFILGIILLFSRTCFGGMLNDWTDPQAYKPRPVLFLHGFNSSSIVWKTAIQKLTKVFSKYQPIGTFLETLDFSDKTGSIDTYADNRDGWADKLKTEVEKLLSNDKYGSYTNKLNLVSYSMGGLAAREFLTNPKYPVKTTDKLILIGTPNLGSPLAHDGKKIITAYKVGSMTISSVAILSFSLRGPIDAFMEVFYLPGIEAPEGIKDMIPESVFLKTLNNRFQPADVQYYGIYGIIGHFFNAWYFKDYYGGDGVVSKKSQLGKDRIIFAKDPVEITAFHTNEVAVSIAGDNLLLKLLDSTAPEFKITSPDPAITTETYETSVQIKGEVFKEYLPADTQLIINIKKQEDGSTFSLPPSFLKPSNLWIPNNPDSVVAEFDQKIDFPIPGTYEVTVVITNPVGNSANSQTVKIKVLASKPIITNILPEGIITELRPIISARIYSLARANIDLSSISLSLDGNLLKYTTELVSGEQDIRVFYTPAFDLSLGKHALILNAQDTRGIAAEEKKISFEIIAEDQTSLLTIYPSFQGCLRKSTSNYGEIKQLSAKVFSRTAGMVGQYYKVSPLPSYRICRAYYCFDTSALADLDIISVKLGFYTLYDPAFGLFRPNWGSDFELEAYLWNFSASLSPEDWDRRGAFLSKILIQQPSSQYPGSWVTFKLPLPGINFLGKTYLQLVSNRDLANISPSASEEGYLHTVVLGVKYLKK